MKESYVRSYVHFCSRSLLSSEYVYRKGSLLFAVAVGKKSLELTRHSSRALNLSADVAPELRRYKDTVKCGALAAEVPGQSQEQLSQTLIVRNCEKHPCFYCSEHWEDLCPLGIPIAVLTLMPR